MTMKKILIITNSHDLHADLLIPLLVKKNNFPFRLNLNDFPRDYQITQQFYQGKLIGSITHIPSGENISIDQIGSTWLRKSADFNYLTENLTPQEKAFAKGEANQALFGFIYSLDCYWMSHPITMRAAMWKTEQLQRALKMGFTIPDSLVTNSPDSVRSFKSNIEGSLIFKAMSSPALAADEVEEKDQISDGLETTVITDEIFSTIDAVSELPCHFQAYIDKQYELRVTIIAGQVFSARINSQEDERTSIDSRDISAEITYQSIELPIAFKQSCLDFVASYDLNYSALDFIVTPEDEYVFLENNPNGQFLYVEQLIPEFKMLEALADTLIKEAICRS
jgi:glutathione synthase/RimK-type ligase-like ATP-grasp enzyme